MLSLDDPVGSKPKFNKIDSGKQRLALAQKDGRYGDVHFLDLS
jgi:hypothetical protein